MNLGTKPHKPSGLARCKRCGRREFAWHRSPATGQQWRLYSPSHAQPDGMMYADLDAPHVCTAPETVASPAPAAPWTPTTATAPPVDFTDDEQEPQETPKAPPQAPAADALASLIAAAVSPLVRGAVDAETVRAIVREELAGHERTVKTELVITRPDGSRETFKSEHPLFPVLLGYVNAGCNVYAWGAPGGGKSTAAAHAAKALGRSYGYISLNPQTTDSRLLGFKDAHGVYQRTPFRDCYENGGVFCIDEMDNASDNLLTTLNGALENGHAAFPDGMVTKHADFVMIATGNTAGRGGSQNHAGRRPFDAATAERFVYVEWTYDEPFEERLTLAQNADARPWLLWVRKVRAYAGQHHPRLVVSPRASMLGARLLKAGAVADAEQLAEAVLFKGLDRDTRAKILAACPLPAVKVAKTEAA